MKELIKKIEDGSAIVGIIGLGYVGLPLATVFARKFRVIGYDNASDKIKALKKGQSYIHDVGETTIRKFLNKTFFPTDDYRQLKQCDFLIICVPTPLDEEREPDLSYIKSACEIVAKILRNGQFITLESTTYPGTTEEIVVPILERRGLKAGVDFGIAFSPERIDPGNKEYPVEKIPKVVGGINKECTEIATKLYGSSFVSVFPVRNCKIAEATKLLENVFRETNIALVNELAVLFEKMGINIWEVIDATSTKPFAFIPHYPGPGVGGHCIPLDPIYLSYEAKKFDFIPQFIKLSTEVNEFMKVHTINLARKGLEQVGKKISGSKFAVMGIAYKKDIDDTRESPAKKIIEQIVFSGGEVKVYDPFAKSIKTKVGEYNSEKDPQSALRGADCAIFVTNHTVFKELDIEKMSGLAKKLVVVDCRNIFSKETITSFGFIYKGIGKPD
jgi:UDP-N-acetyl-D-glucosamine dehydrogenase